MLLSTLATEVLRDWRDATERMEAGGSLTLYARHRRCGSVCAFTVDPHVEERIRIGDERAFATFLDAFACYCVPPAPKGWRPPPPKTIGWQPEGCGCAEGCAA